MYCIVYFQAPKNDHFQLKLHSAPKKTKITNNMAL